MRDVTLPAALLFTALGLALAFAPRRAWVPCFFAVISSLAAFTFLSLPPRWLEGILGGCWMSVIATAAMPHFPRGLRPVTALGLAVNAGIWAGAIASISGSRVALVDALPCLLVVLPASWVSSRFTTVPVRVVSSWVMVVAVLAVTLQVLPVTPGYLPDHLE